MESNFGHKKIIYWQNLDKLDLLVTELLKLVPHFEFKLKSQIMNASDSAEANFVEGYYSNSTGEYLRFLRYSRRSLAELEMRVRRIFRKEYITEEKFKSFEDLCIKTGYLGDRLILARPSLTPRPSPPLALLAPLSLKKN